MYPKSFKKLIDYFASLPSVGPKMAERLVLYLFKQDKDFDKAVAELDKLVPQAASVPSLQQRIYLFQAGILIKGKGDKTKGLERLQLAQKAAPDTPTGQQLVAFIARMQQDSGKSKVQSKQ